MVKIRPQVLELFVRNDTHSPDVGRGTQPLRNLDPFYASFGIESGDPRRRSESSSVRPNALRQRASGVDRLVRW